MPKVCAACLVLILSLAAGTSEASLIVINPGASLTANPDALAAFQRAADTLGAQFSDPVTVTIAADLANLSPGILGTTSSTLLAASYTTVRNGMVADALDEPDDAIVASLPTAAEFSAFMPAGFSLNGNIFLTQANAEALGLGVFLGDDATLVFNSAFGFDYDNSDGVGAGLIDFETVVLHELVHVLGFISSVDTVDLLLAQNSPAPVYLAPLDLFRFVCASAPDTSAEFTSTTRSLVPGATACTSDTVNTWAMSTGLSAGDGRQASNWKDDSISGVHLGIMDPTLATGVSFGLSAADIRALSLIGWDPVADAAAPVPEPATLGLLASGLGILAAARRRRRAGDRRIDD